MPFFVGQPDETWNYTAYSGFNGYTIILRWGRTSSGPPTWYEADATGSGKLYQVKYYGRESGSIRLKIFRDDGTNWLYINGDTANRSVGAGMNTLIISPEWNIQAGDYLGLYEAVNNPSTIVSLDSHVGGNNYKSGNIVTNSLKSSWTSQDGYSSFPTFRGYISSAIGRKWPMPSFRGAGG